MRSGHLADREGKKRECCDLQPEIGVFLMLLTGSLVPVGKGKNEFNSLKLVIVQSNCYSKNIPVAVACVYGKGEIAVSFSPGTQFPI